MKPFWPDPPKHLTERGDGPLHQKILKIPQKIPTQLLTKEFLEQANFHRQTPLHYAAIAGCLKLLPLHEHSSLLNAKDMWGNTPCHYAAEHGHLDQIPTTLLSKKRLKTRNKKGRSPIHLAAEHGHLPQIPKNMLDPKDFLEKDQQGTTPLHLTFRSGDFEHLPPCLLNPPNLTLTNKEGRTPLHHAAVGNHLTQINRLIPLQHNLLKKDRAGNSPLHLADPTHVPPHLLTPNALKEKNRLGNSILTIAAENQTLIRLLQITPIDPKDLLEPGEDGLSANHLQLHQELKNTQKKWRQT